MDTSEQYIKMSDCPEIQGLSPNEDSDMKEWEGSVFWLPDEDKIAFLHTDNDTRWVMIGSYSALKEGCIWLPRQDQLQDMVLPICEARVEKREYADAFSELVEIFWDAFASKEPYEGASFYPPEWAKSDDFLSSKRLIKFTSMEQLWFAFYMFESHNKVWDKDKWEDIKYHPT